MTYDEKDDPLDDDFGLGLDIDDADLEAEKVDREVYIPTVSEEMTGGKVEITTEEKEEVMADIPIFAIKTALGHERTVADTLSSRVKSRDMAIFSVLSPAKIRGYLFMEGPINKEQTKEMLSGVQYARGMVEGKSSFGEIEHFLTPKPLVSGILEGNIVEIISGPFKGEKARVQHVDESKEEITVELFEAMVSIPVTIKGDHVRVIEKEK